MKDELVKEAVGNGALGLGVGVGMTLIGGVCWLGYAAVKGAVDMVKKHREKKKLKESEKENEVSQEEGA